MRAVTARWVAYVTGAGSIALIIGSVALTYLDRHASLPAALRFTTADDGAGYDSRHTPMGSGLRNMADRLAALGGELDVRSAPGSGTTVTGRLPFPAASPAFTAYA
jgi:signal transduction histidine kinase